MKKIGRILIGWMFITLGVIGIIFPVMPGWIFLVSGIIMLAKDIPFFAALICRMENRFPWIRKLILRVHGKANGQISSHPCPPRTE